MKLVFYGGIDPSNIILDKMAIDLTGKQDPSLVYVPFCSYESEIYFNEFINDFKKLGVKRFLYFPIDVPFDPILFLEAMQSDLIHLSGGNTYYFLKYLRHYKMLAPLKKFAKAGGVLTGLSAGGILMTPNIVTAGFPEFDRDENEEGITNLKSLNLVNFEFFPHYKNSPRYERDLLRYSQICPHPLYGVPDGSGIILDGANITFLGKVFCFVKGHKFTL